MNFVDPSPSLLATCKGATVKIVDATVDSGDPCVLSYAPSPGSQVNSVKWNHTNPLPSVAAMSFVSATVPSFRSTLTTSTSGSTSTTTSTVEETPQRSQLLAGGSLAKLHAPRSSYNLKDDDMNVFSPLVDVQPITPSLGNWWDDHDEAKKNNMPNDRKSAVSPSSVRRFPFSESSTDSHPISDWRPTSTSKQDCAAVTSLVATPAASLKTESSSFSTTPEAWGGNALPDKLTQHHQPTSLSRFVPSVTLATGSIYAGLQDSSSSTSHSNKNSMTNSSTNFKNLQNKLTLNNTSSSVILESSSACHLSSSSMSLGTKTIPPSSFNSEMPGTLLSTFPWRYSTYAERISTTSSFSEGIASAVGSPKSKKTGAETREELLESLLSRQGPSIASGTWSLPAVNGVPSQSMHTLGQPADQQGTSSFSLQLVQHTLEETLGSVQKSIHEDVMNLHIELLRQFHMQEVQMLGLLNLILEKQDELTTEVQSLRKENQQLRQLL